MKKRIAFLSLLVSLAAAVFLSPVLGQDNSPANPAAVGSEVHSMIELGSTRPNIYDIAVTVLETVRGSAALDRIKTAGPDSGVPPEGLEYILARIKFGLKGRAVSDRLSFQLGRDPLQWTALSSDLTEYPLATAVPPDPALSGEVQSGSSLEGWVVFLVDKQDTAPVMVFDPDAGGATGRGRTLFFKFQ